MIHHTPKSTLFPYTTLFRSKENEKKSKEFEEEIVVKEYKERIDKLSLQFRVASENGLFSQEKVSNIIADDILQCLLKDRKSTRLNSSHGYISYAVFCLKKKK